MDPRHEADDAEPLASHAHFLRALARRLLFDPAAADDVAQRALLLALQRRPGQEKVRSLREWLGGVVRNFARAGRREEQRRSERERAAAQPEARLRRRLGRAARDGRAARCRGAPPRRALPLDDRAALLRRAEARRDREAQRRAGRDGARAAEAGARAAALRPRREARGLSRGVGARAAADGAAVGRRARRDSGERRVARARLRRTRSPGDELEGEVVGGGRVRGGGDCGDRPLRFRRRHAAADD